MLDPIIGPVKDFFGEISKIFNTVLSAIKDPLEDFFKTLGAFMSGILEVVEPHMPLIGKIISVGLQVMFAPLFLGIRALTAVMKLFTGGKDKGGGEEVKPGGGDGSKTIVSKENATVEGGDVTSGNMSNDDVVDRKIQMLEARKHPGMEKWEIESINNQIKTLEENRATGGYKISDGSEPDAFGFAKGGWIDGPQSGYPVSLDGKRTSFIGHGKEWVGRKAGGKALCYHLILLLLRLVLDSLQREWVRLRDKVTLYQQQWIPDLDLIKLVVK